MKKILVLFTILLFAGSTAFAQCSKSCRSTCGSKKTYVPTAVKESFSKSYSDIKSPNWKKQGAHYQASFVSDDQKTIVLLDSKGNVVEERKEIDKSDLPSRIKSTLKKKYGDSELVKAEEVLKDGKTMYKLRLKSKDGNSSSLVFNASGKLQDS